MLSTLLAPPVLSQVEFVPLDPLPVSQTSDAVAVADDGETVMGWTYLSGIGLRSFVWTPSEGVALLGDEHPTISTAWDVSADGSVIVGIASAPPGISRAFRLDDGRLRLLGHLPGQARATIAFGVSSDGSVTVGSASDDEAGLVAVRWVDRKVERLAPPGSTGEYTPLAAFGASADGSVIAGVGSSPRGDEAFVWDRGELIRLGDLPGGRFDSRANGVSADGRVVVGSSWVGLFDTAPFYWTRHTGMVQLDQLTPGRTTNAWAVSADGWRVLGGGLNERSRGRIILWDPINGTRTLQHIIEEVYQHPLDGWTLNRFGDISSDGTVIVGSGINPAGDRHAFLVRIPPFCYADCDQSTRPGTLDAFDLLCFQNRFAAGDILYADCDRDGALTIFDLLCFQNEFAAGCP